MQGIKYKCVKLHDSVILLNQIKYVEIGALHKDLR